MDLILQIKKLENKFLVSPCKKYTIYAKQPQIVCISKQGLPGPSSDILTVKISEGISSGDIVFFKEGFFLKADSSDPYLRDNTIDYFAFATNSASPESEVQIKQFGIYSNINWNLVSGKVYYLGLTGGIVEIPPVTGLVLPVGIAINTTDLLIKFGTPIWIGD